LVCRNKLSACHSYYRGAHYTYHRSYNSSKQINRIDIFSYIFEELVRFAVPMFVFVSGFVLYNKYKSELPLKDFYKKRLMVILIPYLIFSVLYCIVNAQLSSLPALTLNSVISSIFNFNASGQFWYIQLILTFYIFYPAIIAYYEVIKNRFGIYTPTAFFLSILIIYIFVSFIPIFKLALVTPPRYLIYSNIYYAS
jgi:surface polysaccharide O-acyltransferase-like enzyme